MNNLRAKVMKRYAKTREDQAKAQQERRREIDEKVPAVAQVERKLATTSLKLIRLINQAPADIQEQTAKLKSENLDLKQKKAELLVSAGYPMDYLDLRHQCSLCQDTGFVEGKKCKCYDSQLAAILSEESDFKQLMAEASFENHQDALFRKQPSYPKMGSPADNYQRHINTAKNFVRLFDSHQENLYLYGASGTGKTFLATAIAQSLLKKGILVVYRTAAGLVDDLRAIKFEDRKDLEELLTQAPLVIIDDLGTEMSSDLSKTEIFNLINLRLLNKKKMIVSSNLDLQAVKAKYSDRLASRFVGEFLLMHFFGADLRLDRMRQRTKTSPLLNPSEDDQ